MHLTHSDTLEQVVVSLSSQVAVAEKDSQMHITLITVQHDKIDKITLDYSLLTPKSWYRFYTNTSMCILHSLDLDKIHWLVCREILRIQMKKLESSEYSDLSLLNGNTFILDGFIASISIIFSQFVSNERIDYSQMNFRKIFLILDRLKELDTYLGGRVQINESDEIWAVVGKIYVPCHKESSYLKLVEYLSSASMDQVGEETSKKVLGSEEFVSLQKILEFFGIRRVSQIIEK